LPGRADSSTADEATNARSDERRHRMMREDGNRLTVPTGSMYPTDRRTMRPRPTIA